MHGILLFAHGARNAEWAAPFEAIAAQMRRQHQDGPVGLAFLELMAPDLATAIDALVAAGCRRITVIPMFLGAGGHVRKDLPGLLERSRQAHPGIQIDATATIGESPQVIAALAGTALGLAVQESGR